MKRSLLILFIAFSAGFISCTKSPIPVDEVKEPEPIIKTIEFDATKLYGKWKATESLIDAGDGKGVWKPIVGDSLYIKFNADGTIEGNGFRDDPIGYKILPNSRLEVTLKGNIVYTFGISISGQTLNLRPNCVEGCGTRFVKVE